MRNQPATSDELIARIAMQQHGVVTTAQLRTAGVSNVVASRRARAGRLYRVHRGVYAVGHRRLTFEGRCMAAALAVGGSVVSHRSAAGLWRLLPSPAGAIQVTIAGRGGRSKRQGITIRRSPTLIARMTARRGGIPVTNPARTMRDLRRSIPRSMFRKALRRALDLGLISSENVRDSDLTRSELERRFLTLCRRHRLPQPEVNVRVGQHEVDFLWRDRGLIVETDGFRHHGDRASFEADRARDARLQRLGYRVLRFTYRQLTDDRSAVVAALRELLGQRSLAPNL